MIIDIIQRQVSTDLCRPKSCRSAEPLCCFATSSQPSADALQSFPSWQPAWSCWSLSWRPTRFNWRRSTTAPWLERGLDCKRAEILHRSQYKVDFMFFHFLICDRSTLSAHHYITTTLIHYHCNLTHFKQHNTFQTTQHSIQISTQLVKALTSSFTFFFSPGQPNGHGLVRMRWVHLACNTNFLFQDIGFLPSPPSHHRVLGRGKRRVGGNSLAIASPPFPPRHSISHCLPNPILAILLNISNTTSWFQQTLTYTKRFLSG